MTIIEQHWQVLVTVSVDLETGRITRILVDPGAAEYAGSSQDLAHREITDPVLVATARTLIAEHDWPPVRHWLELGTDLARRGDGGRHDPEARLGCAPE
jgi:hypothetical protein